MLLSSSIFLVFDINEEVRDTADLEDLSDEYRATISSLVQEAQYHLTRHDPSEGFVGSNSRCGFGIIFNESGVSVSPNTENSWSWDIGLSGFGYSGQVSSITTKPQLSVEKNHINYEYSPQLTGWYINDEKGLEQGFTIEAPPQPKINAPLVIEMALETTLTPRAIDKGEAIAFHDDSGEHVLTYKDLIVIDALGQDVSAWLSMSGSSKISIFIDDTSVTYPLTIDPLIVTEVKKLTASDGAIEDHFGWSMSISGDVIVVGARFDDDGASSDEGSAYIFERNRGGTENWGEVTKLTASDGTEFDNFGYSVSISGDVLVVGAPFDYVSAKVYQGSAYVFERNTGGADNWGQVTKLTASDGLATDFFGISVSISGDVLVIGADSDDIGVNSNQGSAYVFERNTGGADNWGQVIKLTASDGATIDRFGRSVSISGDVLVVGVQFDDVGANVDQGSAYVFERNTGGADNWGQVTKQTSSDGAADDCFGVSVSISGDVLVVGADSDDIGVNSNQGSAYVFERNTGGADNWGQVIKLTASDGAAIDRFGVSISISGDVLVVGTPYDNVGANVDQGSAYVFERNTGGADTWGQVTKQTASDGAVSDNFGYSVSISGDVLVVGAPYDDATSFDQGSAYVFKLTTGFVIPLDEGWNLISLPLNQTDTSIDKILSSINGKWDYILVYNSTDPDHWKTNATIRPDQLNDLKLLDHKMGFWINITESWVNLTVMGNELTSTSINLYAGWNLVGYPSLTEKNISDALVGTGYDRVEGFNTTAPYRISQCADSYMMKPGEGYWVHVPADTVWIVDW